MRTQKQIKASRENGRKSHGATTPEGKARIVAASLWSGVYAESEILVWEAQDELQELRDEYLARHPPASPEARCLIDQLIMCEWHLRRFSQVENSLWNHLYQTNPRQADPLAYAFQEGDHTFTRLQHRINSTRRAFHNALKELEHLEARDQDVLVPTPDPDAIKTYSPQTGLTVLGSLRKNDSVEAGRDSPQTGL